MNTNRRIPPRERGFSLAELMVALAVFAIIFVASLMIYDQSNKLFSQGTQSADMQQATRVAWEKLLQDIRLAGFDYKRSGTATSAYPVRVPSASYVVGQMVIPDKNNGHIYRCSTAGTTSTTIGATWSTSAGATVTDGSVVWTEAGALTAAFDQPDEQIEYAWTSAITVRGNFDYDTPDDGNHYEHGRESNLETSQFPVVTTGNHEIVTYALHSDKPGAANSDSVTFYADVNNGGAPSRTAYPGGNAERLITVSSVDLSNSNPPYTLNRYTLADDGSVVTTPLASNIRSMTFSYWEDKPATVPLTDFTNPITNVGGDGQYDPANATTLNNVNRRIRAKIRAVSVQLVGMNSVQDAAFNDGDTNAPHYRKMTLATTVVGRNLGVMPLPQSAVQPPPAPTNVSVCSGYCGVAAINWSPGNGSTGAESYSVAYDISSTGNFSNFFPAGTLTTYALDMTQIDMTTPYYFKVYATNNVGSTGSVAVGPVSIQNATVPSPPSNLVVSVSTTSAPISGKINLSWKSPTTNASGSPTCTTGSTSINTYAAELKGYRVYRGTTAGFVAGPATRIVTDTDPGMTSDGAGNWFYTDTSVSNCTDYWYRVRAVEWCHDNSNDNVSNTINDGWSDVFPTGGNNGIYGYASTGTAPKAPTALAATSSTCATPPGTPNLCTNITLTWAKVTQDTGNNPLNVTLYKIFRAKKKSGAIISASTQVDTLTTTAGAGTATWTEPDNTLTAYDPVDSVTYTYEYYVIANSCGDSGPSNIASVPAASCTTGAVASATGGTGGAGTIAAPYVGATLVMATGAGLTTVSVSIDGGAYTTLASPFHVPWTDSADFQVHTFTFQVSTATCSNQVLPTFYIQNSAPACSAGLVLASPANMKITLSMSNTASEQLNLQSIDVSWGGPSHINWIGLTAPSNAAITITNPICTNACTKSFTVSTLTASSDKNIPVSGGGSLVYTMLFQKTQANPSTSTSDVTGYTVHYTRSSTGSQIFDCTLLP